MPSFPQIGLSVKCLFLYVQIFIHLSASAIVQDMGHQIKTVKIKGFGILGKFLRRDDGFERHYLKSAFNSLLMRNVKNLNPRAIPKVAIDHINGDGS